MLAVSDLHFELILASIGCCAVPGPGVGAAPFGYRLPLTAGCRAAVVEAEEQRVERANRIAQFRADSIEKANGSKANGSKKKKK